MANIPVIPGVSVATKGILNKSLKDIICALLFGGLNNMLKGPLICVNLDLDKLISEKTDLPSLKDLQTDLKKLKDQLKVAEESLGIKEALGRVNGAIAEVQSLLALNGLCAIPMKAPPITDVLGQIIDAEFAEMNAILNDLGRLAKPSICLDGRGGLSPGGGYNPKSILDSIAKHGGKMSDIPGNALASFKKRIQGVTTALKKSVNRQLFPDFRHKHNLATGKPYVPGQTYAAAGVNAAGVPALKGQLAQINQQLASDPNNQQLELQKSIIQASITSLNSAKVPVITLAAAPTADNQWNGPYPPADTPNLKDASATAQILVASVGKSGSYPADVNGIRSVNIWPGLLGPELYSMAVEALTQQDPLFVQQDPVYDYCGRLVGYDSTVITGDQTALGGNPALGADLNPPTTNFNILWVEDRNCWAVDGNTSEQLIDAGRDTGRKGVYLNKNPIIEMHRGYTHIFGIPSMALSLGKPAPEFYIYKVNADLTPNTSAPFNLGLSRLETYELLEDANGIDGGEGEIRRVNFPMGTTLYFEAEARVYSGTTPPDYPSETIWWYNTETGVAQRYTLNKDTEGEVIDGTGYWTTVSNQDRADKWVGSSYITGDPHVNYLCYSNKDGSVFGLLKFI